MPIFYNDAIKVIADEPRISFVEIVDKLSKIKCGDWKLMVDPNHTNGYYNIHLTRWVRDIYTDNFVQLRIIAIIFKDEFQSTVYLDKIKNSICEAEIHEVNEHFLYAGERIFNPHKNA